MSSCVVMTPKQYLVSLIQFEQPVTYPVCRARLSQKLSVFLRCYLASGWSPRVALRVRVATPLLTRGVRRLSLFGAHHQDAGVRKPPPQR